MKNFIQKFIFVVMLVTVIALGITTFAAGDDYVGNDPGWPPSLQDLERAYSINCTNSPYILTISPPGKENIGGVYIGSSTKELDQFCGKLVTVQAQARESKGSVLCSPLRQGYDDCLKQKSPVVDILDIQELDVTR